MIAIRAAKVATVAAIALFAARWVRDVARSVWTGPSVAAHFSPRGGCTAVIVAELARARSYLTEAQDRAQGAEDLFWALLNSGEFYLNH